MLQTSTKLEGYMNKILFIGALAVTSCALVTGVQAQAVRSSPPQTPAVLDYAHAKPMSLPRSNRSPTSQQAASPTAIQKLFSSRGVVPGSDSGDGKLSPIQLVPSVVLPTAGSALGGGVTSQEYGTSNHVFTTSRADAFFNTTASFYPYRAAGKLFFKVGAGTSVCSASLIKPGVIVTAAHCVANFGIGFYSNWEYVPAYSNGSAPYGTWTGLTAFVLASYLNGTDTCAVAGVVCQNDVAVIVLNKKSGALPGTRTGWLSYAYGGYSFNPAGQALITQLGYPVALDAGALMQRTDSQGFVSVADANNTIIGSLQTGGSSGGPWAVNLGLPPVLNGTGFGTDPVHNVVVGVTSWGYINTAIKEQGASPFLFTNIGVLVNAACAAYPGWC